MTFSMSLASRGVRSSFGRENLDVSSVLNHAIEAVRPLIEQRNHHLTVAYAPESLRIDADPTRLEQIVVNLLTNAAKYTHPGGQISLTAQRGPGSRHPGC